jgi:hypothetical protein
MDFQAFFQAGLLECFSIGLPFRFWLFNWGSSSLSSVSYGESGLETDLSFLSQFSMCHYSVVLGRDTELTLFGSFAFALCQLNSLHVAHKLD